MIQRKLLNLLTLSLVLPLVGCGVFSRPKPAPEAVVIFDDGLDFGEYRFDASRGYLPTFCNSKTGRCFVHGIEEHQVILDGICSVPAHQPAITGSKAL